MLKLPMGCASVPNGRARSQQKTSVQIRSKRTAVLLVGPIGLSIQAHQSLSCNGCLQRIELRRKRQSAMQILAGGGFIAGSMSNHACVIEQLGVLGTQMECIFDGGLCLGKPAGFERGPGQSVRAVNVATDGIFLGGHRIGLLCVEVMVGEEERLLPVVEYSGDAAEMGYNANQLIS